MHFVEVPSERVIVLLMWFHNALCSFQQPMQSGNITMLDLNHLLLHSPKAVDRLLEGEDICLDEECKVKTIDIRTVKILCQLQ